MKFFSLIAPLASAMVLLGTSDMHAAELQVLAGGGITAPFRELGPKFESATGHTVVFRFGTTPELIKLVGGSAFDVAVPPRELFEDAPAAAKFMPEPRTDVARVGLGVAVRAGAAKPDISTPEALKQALLKAQSISTLPESAAGAMVLRAFARLGIADALQPKIKAQATPAQVVQAVANGEAELGVFLVNVLMAPGLDLVGAFPPEAQQEIVYTAGIAADSKQADAAKAFLTFLKSPAAIATFKAKGLTPG